MFIKIFNDFKLVLQILQPTNLINLHSSNCLSLKNLKIQQNGCNISITKWELNEKYEVLSLQLNENVSGINFILTIEFKGILNDTLRGFYRSKYQQ